MKNGRHSIVGSIISAVLLFAEVPSGAQFLPLGSEFQVATYTIYDQQRSAVGMAGDGRFVVVWEDGSSGFDRDGDQTGIFGRRYSSTGSVIGSEFLVNSYTTGEQFDVAVSMSPNGAFITVWGSFPGRDGDPNCDSTHAQLYTSSGSRNGSEFVVNTFSFMCQEIPDVAMDQNDNFVITWNSEVQDGDDYGIFARRYSSNGSPIGAEFMVNTYTPFNQSYPAIGIDSAANFVIVWSSGGDRDGSGSAIFGQRFASNGGSLGTEFQVNSSTMYDQGSADVQKKADGDFVVVWSSYAGIFAQRFGSVGGKLGTEFQVSPNGEVPKLAWVTGDSFLVTWVSDSDQILARHFASGGSAIGTEFQVNAYTDAIHSQPAIAADGTNRFVVTQQSFLQDGDGFGVFAQLFGPTATPTSTPTATPTSTPTATPTSTPTATPTSTPTATPTSTPTATPTSTPTNTPTATPTNTPTATPTNTPTATPTNTPRPDGASCDSDSLCESGNCVDGVCCNTACDGELEQCNLSSLGICTSIVAPAPSASGKGLAMAVGLLTLIAFFTLRRLRAS